MPISALEEVIACTVFQVRFPRESPCMRPLRIQFSGNSPSTMLDTIRRMCEWRALLGASGLAGAIVVLDVGRTSPVEFYVSNFAVDFVLYRSFYAYLHLQAMRPPQQLPRPRPGHMQKLTALLLKSRPWDCRDRRCETSEHATREKRDREIIDDLPCSDGPCLRGKRAVRHHGRGLMRTAILHVMWRGS